MWSVSRQRGKPSTPDRRTGRRRLAHLAMQIAVLCCVGSAAVGAESKGPLYGKVVCYPKNGNCYEMVQWPNPYKDWAHSYKAAQARTHQGVRGRLAVVNDAHLHEFIKNTFRPYGITWIGLRYWCKYNKLQWVTGEFLKPGDFTAWDTPWASGTVSRNTSGLTTPYCGGGTSYWPVHYWGVEQSGRWNANGQPKVGHACLVEYPMGRK